MQNVSIQVLNESVEALGKWISRSRAPNGFSPGFHLAKSLAGMQLPSLLTSAKQLEAGQYNYLPSFVSQLISALSAIHAMVIYAPKSEQSTINADFTAELSQSLSLLNTAQKKLAEKHTQLEATEELVEGIKSSHEEILAAEQNVLNSKNEIDKSHDQARQSLDEINSYLEIISQKQKTSKEEIESYKQKYQNLMDSHESEFKRVIEEKQAEYVSLLDEHNGEYTAQVESHNKKYEKYLSDSSELNETMHSMVTELSRLQEKCKEQEKVIDSIIPRGASAGLAAAFSLRGKQLEKTKWIWLVLFVVSLSVLSGFAWNLANLKIPEGVTFWDQLLSRLPLVAPLVWLGWFSAIQYGNIIRVQEDYAFKEATSKAYQGYKDHMEHLGSVDLDEARTALTLLSETTIQVLGREPLRIYGKSEQDASPAHSFSRMLRSQKKREPEKEKEE